MPVGAGVLTVGAGVRVGDDGASVGAGGGGGVVVGCADVVATVGGTSAG